VHTIRNYRITNIIPVTFPSVNLYEPLVFLRKQLSQHVFLVDLKVEFHYNDTVQLVAHFYRASSCDHCNGAIPFVCLFVRHTPVLRLKG